MFHQYLAFAAIIVAALFVVVDSKTVSSGGLNYYISTIKKNWYMAQRHCTSLGMDLIDITSSDENNRLLRILKNPQHVNVTEPQFWIGGTDNGREGNFYWATTGNSVTYSDYYRVWMQPDNYGGNENCLQIFGQWDYKWNDGQCLAEHYFVCREVNKLPLDNCICMEGLKTIY